MRIREDYAGYGKRATNVSINQGLLDAAKALDINLSATLERALEQEVRARRRQRWLEENREAIEGYNAWVAEHGVFSPMFRKR
ncbi:type II toxin-antitoxin system CcdA family antitoxin [Luteimonas sp. M1R5S18]|jgi:antitoxin CcdA|uniref:Type II toxin-antitoxin system CcdA family antitoxin n=1 Tax=Luteimonas rhizosphaericola TaxID=3042024 RepID=A0ABT6JMM5_9GAMM|nr:type II toxin-antitoxin system CcdA family antitoxin [Luteimonas rhizosphaericola]MDH5831331.1 type II toxin-antitoxin system CcdA family antitoxin [Luteimonas rhizosphaericola]